MYKIGLTGGIGTGKTFVSKQFLEMGIPVFNADDEAKTLYLDPEFCQLVGQTLGQEVMLTSDMVNLKKLAQMVFSDQKQLMKLNQLVHPRVMQMFDDWGKIQDVPAIMMESALIFESNMTRYFDKIIVIDAPLELRISRIKARNPEWTHEDILQRIARQMPQEEKCQKADLIIWTGDTYRETTSL